jgi:signal transduction histidine kinase
VESTPGKGSKFTVSLPLPVDTRQPANAASGATA